MSLNYRPHFESGGKGEFFAKVSELNGLKSPLYGLSAEALSMKRFKEFIDVYSKHSEINAFPVARVFSYKKGKHGIVKKIDIVEFEREVASKVSKLKSQPAEFRILYLFDFFGDVLYHRDSALDIVVRNTYSRKPNDTFIAIRILSKKNIDFLTDFIKMKNGEYGIRLNDKLIPVLAFDLVAENYNSPDKLADFIMELQDTLQVPSVAFDLFSVLRRTRTSVGIHTISVPIPPRYQFKYLIKETADILYRKEIDIPLGVFHVRKNVPTPEDVEIHGAAAHGLPIYGIDYMFCGSINQNYVPDAPIIRSPKRKWMYVDKEEDTEMWIYKRVPQKSTEPEGLINKMRNLQKEHRYVKNGELKDVIFAIEGLKLVL
ncbi:hypothetical protein [Geoglobus ahangari]